MAVYALGTLVLIPFQALLVVLKLGYARRFPRVYHGLCRRLFGFEVRVHGEKSTARPTLFVSNHVSYIDIMVLGSLLEAGFVAKAEIARWPFFGVLARLQGCVFVDRRSHKASAQRDEIEERLAAGDNLILFPEGTSGDGRAPLPFKSALFAVAMTGDGRPALAVQPVSISYTRLDGLPLGRALRPYLAWYGGMTLMPHLLSLLGLGRVTAEVRFHPVLDAAAYPSRKALAEACRRVIAEGMDEAKRGRAAGANPAESAEPVVAREGATS